MQNELKTWADLAERYSLVLFNNAVRLGDGEVLQEWFEQHTCEAQEAQQHIESCEVKNCKKCEEYRKNFGEYPTCECEPAQWFAIDINEFDEKYLKAEFDLDIFYSEYLGIYMLAVHHYGTAWRMLKLTGGYADEV